MFSQIVYFAHAHPEKLPSVIKRYQDEVVRVYNVMEGVFKKSEKDWLVGDKISLADLAFIM